MKDIKEVNILAIGVHPDDVELACSGTLVKHIRQGNKVGILDLTLGEMGTRGNPTLRTQEAYASAELMKASFRHQLNLADCFFDYNKESLIRIIEVIRASKAKIILANAVSDRHPDHGKAAKLISNAVFYSGLRKIATSFNSKTQEPHRPEMIYHYIQDHHLKADLVIDISECIEEKMNLIQCFKSQFYDPNSIEPVSPISGKDFLENVRAHARIYGRIIGAEYGEGYTVERSIGVDNFNALR